MHSLQDRFAQAMAPFETLCAQHSLGVAVSGGSDSLALMYLLAGWTQERGTTIKAATVDHQLRPEARQEAEHVAQLCATLGIAHDILTWSPSEGSGNISMAARDGRYRLLSDWIGKGGILFLGHTQDDQAETFLMRLRRGSGVDGLAAMQMQTRRANTTLLRPMLGLRREELRSYLSKAGVTWCEDPTNENDAYERVRMRKAMGQLQELGLDASRLAKTAEYMARAKEALNARAFDMARTIARQELNSIVFEWEALACLEEETRFRLISAALLWVSKTTYRPRYASLVEAWDHIMRGKSVTLAGCLITASKRRGIRVMREINAQPNNAQFCEGMTWDMGWTIGGPCQNGLSIRPLGQDGLRQITGPYDANLPKRLCYTQPAIFDQETLIACPSLVKHSAYSVAFSADTPFLSAFAH